MSQSKPKILILFYSMYDHIFRMANAVVEGAREGSGEAVLKQVAELIPEELQWNHKYLSRSGLATTWSIRVAVAPQSCI
ncbi:MAG: hypothetical protein OEY95_02460 [Candidatus Bathyarchaeota archaeon]|nr:hypothetical protein [Candidatus Bathyarchaeota archaeon]